MKKNKNTKKSGAKTKEGTSSWMNNGNREFLYIHLRRGNSCSTCPSLSLATAFLVPFAFCLALLPAPVLLLSSLLLLNTLRVSSSSSSSCPRHRLCSLLSYSLTTNRNLLWVFHCFYIFIWFTYFFRGGVVVQTREIVEELTLEDVVLGFFLFVLCCTHSCFWELGFFSFPVLTCELLLFGGGTLSSVFLLFAQASSSPLLARVCWKERELFL
jgi:hypothetical protein